MNEGVQAQGAAPGFTAPGNWTRGTPARRSQPERRAQGTEGRRCRALILASGAGGSRSRSSGRRLPGTVHWTERRPSGGTIVSLGVRRERPRCLEAAGRGGGSWILDSEERTRDGKWGDPQPTAPYLGTRDRLGFLSSALMEELPAPAKEGADGAWRVGTAEDGNRLGVLEGGGLPKQKQPQTDELLAASGKLPSFLTMSAIPSGGGGGILFIYLK